MDNVWKKILWRQFGAAIDMLENAMHACPEELWSDPAKPPVWIERDVVGFWYVAYHTLFFLDVSLSGSVEGFAPPEPFTLSELDPAGLLPERPYTKEELQTYLDHCRAKCHATIAGMTDAIAQKSCELEWVDVSHAELLLYNMRHVQHHTAQLNLMLRQETGSAPRWVKWAKEDI